MYVLMNYKTLYVCLMTALAQVLSVGMMQATEAGTGVFSVSSTKTVRFANANSVYSENELIQWANLGEVKDEGWDVLTGDEWSYLLVSGRTNANDLNALGTVNGTKGLIILPDEWVQPGTVPAFKPVDQGIAYDMNKYTAEQWAVMADAGAVFLPCGGYGYNDKEGYHVVDATDHGAYWAKDAYNSSNAKCMRFNLSEIHDLNNAAKTNYYSVILVKVEIEQLDEEDDADTYFDKWDAAKGKDLAYVKRTLKKDSTLYTLCLPFDVPDIDDSPLAGAEVFEFKGGRVSGTTGNERLFLQLSRLNGKRLTQGVPYLLRWAKTDPVETLPSPLYFAHVENWDTDTTTAAHPGNETIKLRGVYPKAHIPGYTSGAVAHYNFFMGANNTLYWPDDNLYPSGPDHDMKGFRAYFYITAGSYPASAPKYRNMPVVWQIGDGLSSPTDIGERLMVNGEWQKVLRNGQIILVIDGKEYDLQGRKIND